MRVPEASQHLGIVDRVVVSRLRLRRRRLRRLGLCRRRRRAGGGGWRASDARGRRRGWVGATSGADASNGGGASGARATAPAAKVAAKAHSAVL